MTWCKDDADGVTGVARARAWCVQLRDEFDTGRDVLLTPDHNAHDVAALLKEFFRDLPDPLLTRDLYSAYVATCSAYCTAAHQSPYT